MQEIAFSYPPDDDSRGIMGDLEGLLDIFRRGWRVAAVVVVVCLLLAVFYLALTKREYQATARLLFMRHGGRPLNVTSSSGTDKPMQGDEEYLPTYSSLIASPKVLQRAIAMAGLENLPTLLAEKKAGGDPVDVLTALLKVTRPDRQAMVLRVDYRAGSPEEATRTLEAVLASYEKFLVDTFQEANQNVIKVISSAADVLGKRLKEMETSYQELRRKSMVLANGQGRPFVTSRLEQWDRESNGAMVKAVQLRAILELGRKLEREGADLWTVVHAMNQLGGDSSTLIAAMNAGKLQGGSSDYIRQLAQEKLQLADRFGPKYAKVQELQKRISQVNDTEGRSDRTELQGLLNSIEASLVSLEGMRSEIAVRFGKDQEKAREAEAELRAETELRSDLERQRALFNTVMDQLKQAEFIVDFSTISARTIEPARALKSPVWPRKSYVLGLALAFGCVGGAVATLVAYQLDRRIRSVGDLRKVMNLQVLGQIPQAREGEPGAGGEFGLIGHSMPRSQWAEAYREARTNLEFHRLSCQAKAIMVTSPNHGDGKSVSASNLAVSLAHAGRKVLLIDGDLRKPSQHKIHGLNKDRGLTHLLNDLLPFHRVVQRTSIGNLDLIANGPGVGNPADLLMASRFADLLATAKQRYDVVIVDAPPILRVTDTMLMGVAVDAVVLVIRDASLSPEVGSRVLELLKSRGIPILGTVINRTDPDRQDYGYGYDYDYGDGAGPNPVGAIEHKPSARWKGLSVNGRAPAPPAPSTPAADPAGPPADT